MTFTLPSTLHFGPNAVKAILKIASHLDFRKHRCEGEVNQTLREWRKEENAQLLNENLGIRVQNWFSVDGNTARKGLSNITSHPFCQFWLPFLLALILSKNRIKKRVRLKNVKHVCFPTFT